MSGRGRSTTTIGLIEAMVDILQEIQPCSVRAVAYQLFTRKLIPSMSTANVARVSRLLVIAREEGTISWDWIVDPTRQVQRISTWADPADFARSVQSSYRRNKWDAQPKHVMVWSEKGTVEGTLAPVLDQYEVPFQVLHGWSGATPIRAAAMENLRRVQDTILLYVGDYDPSGMGMSELDLPRRLARYSTDNPSVKDVSDAWVAESLASLRLEVRRIALTEDDTVALGAVSSFPAEDKIADSRYEWFVDHYDDACWELDALSPVTLRERVQAAITAELDPAAWDRYGRG
jgi:hypothetical protein